MTWAELFDRAPEGVSVADVRAALAERRGGEIGASAGDGAESLDQGAGEGGE